MQNWRESYDRVFEEMKNLLSELSKSHTYEDILMKENEINQLYQKFSFLKVSQNFEFSSTEIEPLQIIENQLTNSDSNLISVEDFEEENKVADIVVEETEIYDIFDDVPEVEEVHSFEEIDAREDLVEETVLENEAVNEIVEVQNEEQIDEEISEISTPLNVTEDIINESEETIETQTPEEILLEEATEKLEPMQDSQFSFAMEKEQPIADVSNDDYEARLAEKEAKLKELEENRRKIVEFSKEDTEPKEKSQEVYESPNQETHHDKKFKLANIKGLKVAKSLFDDDHLEELEKPSPVQNSGSLLKNNVPTDYMEAPKPKPEFKLDLNDRIAFSQYLFDGSQSELNQVVSVLNSFNSLEKAQEFLSDVYYERNWKKVDNYAQRLWTLVENRFL